MNTSTMQYSLSYDRQYLTEYLATSDKDLSHVSSHDKYPAQDTVKLVIQGSKDLIRAKQTMKQSQGKVTLECGKAEQ